MRNQLFSIVTLTVVLLLLGGCHRPKPSLPPSHDSDTLATVVMVRDISPEALVRIYNHFDIQTPGRVAVKMSTGESGKSNYLRPELIKELVQLVNGTIVECNCAYWGNRDNNEEHWKAIQERGFLDLFNALLQDHLPESVRAGKCKTADLFHTAGNDQCKPLAKIGKSCWNVVWAAVRENLHHGA